MREPVVSVASHGRGAAASLALLALAALSPLTARADALADDMTARIEKANPGVAVQVQAPDRLVLRRDGKDIGLLDLGNLREICSKHPPSVCEEQKQRRVSARHLIAQNDKRPLAPASIRPIVRPTAYRAAVDAQLPQMTQGKSAEDKRKAAESRPMLNDLGHDFVSGWAEDSADGMSPISASRMKDAGLTVADLDRLGAANLRQEQVAPLQPAGRPYPGVFATRGNDYLPSVLVNEAFWQRVAGAQAARDVAVCMPARHELFVHVPALDPSRTIDFPALCQRLAQNAAPAFSDRVVRRVGGRWLLN